MKDSSNYLLALAASEETEMIAAYDAWHTRDKWVDKWGGEIN